MTYKPLTGKKGIAVIEVMIVIVVLVVAVTIAVPIFLQTRPVDRTNITREKIRKIKHAIVGDRQKFIEKSRTSFGFVGDLGVLPNTLSELREQGTYPSIAQSQNIWFGWQGPYLTHQSDLFDAWGNPIRYTDDNTLPINRDDLDNLEWPVRIWSCGEDGLPNTEDDVYESGNADFQIYENEVRSFVEGTFTNRLGEPIPQDQVTVYFPNGTAFLDNVIITTGSYEPGKTAYSSKLDVVSDPNKKKIPIGTRYFLTEDEHLPKLATLNGVVTSDVHFVADTVISPPTGDLYERTFYSTDKDTQAGGDNYINQIMPTWKNVDGNYFTDDPTGEYRAVFGRADWEDYRIEVDATLYGGRGYGIYYRSDGATNITGYCFQYDPGLTSGGRVCFAVRKVYSGGEQSPFQEVVMSLSQFPDVYNASHHTSITVQGNHHIIKVDGEEIFNFIDNSFLTGMTGFRSWDGQHLTDFHHVLVYEIPPLATGETVWWSFEEGSGETVYGSGFLIGADEINGTIHDQNHIDRVWANDNLYGQSLLADGHNNGYINFGDVLDFDPTDEFTISVWVKLNSINPSREYTIISKVQQQGAWDRGWILRLMEAGGNDFGAVFSIGNRVDSNRELKRINNLSISGGIQTGEWYHIAVTYDGTGYSGNTTIPEDSMVIYVTPQSSAVVTTPSVQTISQTLRANHQTVQGASMTIGSGIIIGSPFQGYIDEVRVYGRALTAAEVNDVFQKHR